MKKTALIKDILREIKKTRMRFLSITVMIMLGVFVLVGLKVTGPMMRENATIHTEEQNMYDIRIKTPVGINDEDIDEIKKVSDIDILEPVKSIDLTWIGKKLNVSIESYKDNISTPEIIEGRAPEREGEILIEYISSLDDVKIGDEIEFQKETDKFKDGDDDYLKTYKYTVVGKAISTDYIMQGVKGMSFQTGSSIDTIGYIIEDNFNKEDYSFAKLRFNELIDKDPESSEYKKYVNGKKTELKNLLESRSGDKFEEIKEKNYKKINDAQKEINDAKEKINDAEKEFEDAKEKLDDAKITLDDAKAKIEEGQDELEVNEAKARQKIEDAKIKIKDGKEQLEDGKKEIADYEQEYKDGLAEYESGLKDFKDAENKVLDNERKLRDGIYQAENGFATAKSGYDTATSGLAQIEVGISQIDATIIRLKSSPYAFLPQIQAKIAELDAQKSALIAKQSEAKAGIEVAKAGMAQARSAINELNSKKRLIDDAKQQIEEKRVEIDEARIELVDAKYKIDDAKRKIVEEEQKLKDAEQELADAEQELEDELRKGHKKINDAIAEYNEGEADYIEGKNEYDEKHQEFIEKKADALVEISDGEEKIKDAKEIINNLSEPRFIVSTRNDNEYLYFLYESSENLDIVSWIFPLFFFFVAILVSIATMTRMVEENRIEIGTYKSLGYSRGDIYKKFILYGLISSLLGGILGGILGSTILPKAIYGAYSASYTIKELVTKPSILINVGATILAAAANVLTIYLVVKSTLNENAASLLRPKAPKKAHKIMLEKIPFIWKHLQFLNKVTLRNLFRYKARMYMTIFGVACCTGLVFLGLSLREAIGGIEYKQYGEIYKYDISISTDKSLPKDGLEELEVFLNSDRVDDFTRAYVNELVIENEVGRDQSVILKVPEDNEDFNKLVHLKHEKSFGREKKVTYENPTINHKLMAYAEDGVITVRDPNLKYHEIKVDKESTDFYLGHVLFMEKDDYEDIFEEEFEPNSYLVRLSDKDDIAEIIEELRNNTSVLTVTNLYDNLQVIEDWVGSIGIITIIILFCSAALAFVVLYNLTNINISERQRELSTIKVLGFTTEELTSYIYRETVMLSIIGILVGFLVGWVLLGTVSEVLSPDNIQMNLLLTYKPYLYSSIITMVFVFIIRRIVIKKLRGIDMVESLKSYE